jgi:hypothetical protein
MIHRAVLLSYQNGKLLFASLFSSKRPPAAWNEPSRSVAELSGDARKGTEMYIYGHMPV